VYVKNAWYVAAWTQDLEAAKPLAMTILEEPIVLWRAGDRVVAMEDRCVHRLAPLSRGRCEGATLRCMYHGMVFDADGKVVEIPGQALIPAEAKVRTYPVVEKHSWIWVWMGDPARADQALIPPAVGYDDPDWILGHGQLDYKAEARLINDNLLDFSHFAFVHEQSLNTGRAIADTPPTTIAEARGVRFQRWNLASRNAIGDIIPESWMEYEYNLPGILLSLTGTYAPGAAEAANHAHPGDAPALFRQVSSQAVTPMGPKTSRYFFSIGVHRMSGDESARDAMVALIDKAFIEDREMIEAQQRIIDVTPNPKIMPTAHDRGTTIFNQMIAKLIRQETAAAPSELSTARARA
jgi:phenylpropionate dioxygenase-like ring-hydroxylating dioxygenase large terminal subunit